MDIIQQALSAGFTVGTPMPKGRSLNNGWFGCTTQHPDLWLNKGDKELQISLGCMAASHIPYTDSGADPEVVKLFPHNVRYIALKNGCHFEYQTFTGVMPGAEVLRMFFEETPENIGGK